MMVKRGNVERAGFSGTYAPLAEVSMPAVPLYLHRLDAGIAALEALAADVVDRRALEEALGVGKWTAWRIMKRCGGEDGPGGALVCRRPHLLAQLRRLQQDGRFAPEIERRNRVERYLDGMLQFASRKHKEIARNTAAEALLSSRFRNLPAGVELRPGKLEIEFRGPEDFLRKFGAVVFALNNDWERISEYLETDTAITQPEGYVTPIRDETA
jgi:hypothetical protein